MPYKRLIVEVISKFNTPIYVTVIIGPGFSLQTIKKIEEFIKKNRSQNDIEINLKISIKEMALEMREHELVITSNGRTVYEATSLGIPIISFSQNEREDMHLFSKFAPSVTYLGRYNKEKGKIFKDKLNELIQDPNLLRSQNKSAIKFAFRQILYDL